MSTFRDAHLVPKVVAGEHDARVLEAGVVEDVPEERRDGGGLPVVQVQHVRLLAHLLHVLQRGAAEVSEPAEEKNVG